MNMKIENRNDGKRALISFFAIVLIISAVVEALICRGGPEWLYAVLMWIPAVAATVANCVFFRENSESFSVRKLISMGGFQKSKLRYVLLGCLLPLIYLLIPYMIYWGLCDDWLRSNTIGRQKIVYCET